MIKKVLLGAVLLCLSAGCYTVESLQALMPKGDGLIIAPADGQVLKIFDDLSGDEVPVINEGGKKVSLNELKGMIPAGSQLVVIFMRPHNKHVQLSPISGEVVLTEHVGGSFKNVFKEYAYLENEHNSIVIDGDVRVAVIQIAGFIFRRISCAVQKGESVGQGDKLGNIAFGSAVGIIVPGSCKLSVVNGQKVKVGQTIIATYDVAQGKERAGK